MAFTHWEVNRKRSGDTWQRIQRRSRGALIPSVHECFVVQGKFFRLTVVDGNSDHNDRKKVRARCEEMAAPASQEAEIRTPESRRRHKAIPIPSKILILSVPLRHSDRIARYK